MAKKRKPQSDYEVYLQGHCSRIGDGLRGVQLVKLGRLWVKFKTTHGCKTCTVTKAVWERLVERAYSRRVA